MYCFSILEWNVVWSCERLVKGSVYSLPERTSGIIAKRFAQIVTDLPEASVKAQLTPLAARFRDLVEIRNGLAHGRPGTDTDGGQRIFRDGMPWTIEAIDDAADDFTACSIELNAFVHSTDAQSWGETGTA